MGTILIRFTRSYLDTGERCLTTVKCLVIKCYCHSVSVLLGKDASLAFVTGDFTEIGLTDDVSSLSPLQMLALYDWLAFYQKHYQPVGKW